VLAREPLGIDDCALYPLFDDELLALMRRVISPDKEHAVGVAVIFRARRGKKKSP
jgi:arsenite methyltransferase